MFLVDHLFSFLLENINLNLRQVKVFQQDGGSAHNNNLSADHLNKVYTRRWINTNSPISSGYLKHIVYNTPLTDVEYLKVRIRITGASIAPESLRTVTSAGLIKRYQKYVVCDGRTFGHLI